MGEARRRRQREQANRTEVLYSEPWPCPNCSSETDDDYEDVVFEVRNDMAHCVRCRYGTYRRSFGFTTMTAHHMLPDTLARIAELEAQRKDWFKK